MRRIAVRLHPQGWSWAWESGWQSFWRDLTRHGLGVALHNMVWQWMHRHDRHVRAW